MANTKSQQIANFEGFGNSNVSVNGEYHRSSGFSRSKHGITMRGRLDTLINSNTLTDSTGSPLSLAWGRSRSVTDQSQGNFLLSSDANGGIIQSANGSSSGTSGQYLHRAMANAHANFMHLIYDQKGRLLYHQDRYLGMFDPSSATTNYITGTVAVTNGSNAVVGTGTTFDAGWVGKAIKISGTNGGKKFYIINTVTDATHLTLTSNFTGTTSSGNAYVINVAFNDSWKDFGAAVTVGISGTARCPMDLYEDTVLFGRGNVITTLNVLTDSITTDGSPAFSLPSGYSIDHIVSNSNGILIGGNTNDRGFVLLWDNFSDRSIAPWIWFSDGVLGVCKDGSDWLVTTSKGVYRTNGYTAVLLVDDFLDSNASDVIQNSPKNTIVVGKYLHFGGASASAPYRRAVMYRMNLKNKLVEAVPRNNMDQYNMQIVQFEYSKTANTLFVLSSGVGILSGVERYRTQNAAPCGHYITSVVGKGSSKKVATALRVKIRKNTNSFSFANAFTFSIALKIADMKKSLYANSVVKSNSANKHTIVVDNSGGSFTTPSVGDEIEFAGDNSGSTNNYGYSRNVTNVTGAGTANETITLESDFPDTPQANQNFIITPFQLVKRKAITVTNGEIEEIYFDVKNKIKGRNYMMKIEIEANTSGIPLEVEDMDFIYEDLGLI